jgi:hypothetical protein
MDRAVKQKRARHREGVRRLGDSSAPQMLTLINNVVLGLLSRRGVRNVPEARRRFAAHLNEAAQLVLGSSV